MNAGSSNTASSLEDNHYLLARSHLLTEGS